MLGARKTSVPGALKNASSIGEKAPTIKSGERRHRSGKRIPPPQLILLTKKKKWIVYAVLVF
jgi:hypothetical protein